MRKFFGTVEDQITGKPISGATVDVLTAASGSGGTAVTIYSDDGVTETTTAGQVTTDQYGYYEFYVADGTYCLETKVNGTLKRSITDVEIFAGSYDEVAALDIRVDALEAAISASGTYNATSSTSLAIGTGSKSFTVETGKSIVVGQFYLAADASTPSNYMYGQVTSYNSGTGALVINVTVTNGSGTLADWVISPTFYIPALMKDGDTATDVITFATPASGQESIIIPHGAAPSSPTNGSVWSDTTGFWARVSGVTRLIAMTSGAQTLTTKTLVDPTLQGTPTEDIFTISDGASVTIDPSDGSIQLWTLGANRTPTLTSITAGKGILLGVDDGTAYTLTLSGVTWITGGGAAPTLKTTGYTWVSIFNIGGTLYAALIGDGG